MVNIDLCRVSSVVTECLPVHDHPILFLFQFLTVQCYNIVYTNATEDEMSGGGEGGVAKEGAPGPF